MGKYLVLWEIDTTRLPVSPKERGAASLPLVEMVKQDIKKGVIKDWGVFVGEDCGYSVAEGTESEIMNTLQPYVPFVRFKSHAIGSLTQVEEMLKALTK